MGGEEDDNSSIENFMKGKFLRYKFSQAKKFLRTFCGKNIPLTKDCAKIIFLIIGVSAG